MPNNSTNGSVSKPLAKVRPSLTVPVRYRTTCLTPSICTCVGFSAPVCNRLSGSCNVGFVRSERYRKLHLHGVEDFLHLRSWRGNHGMDSEGHESP